jgi:predicted ATPase
MAADVRARVHHGIARNLIDSLAAAERASRVFEIVAHAELGRVERRSREELEELIQLELEAADQAQQASGQAIAAQRLASALACLDGEQWSQTPRASLRHLATSSRVCGTGRRHSRRGPARRGPARPRS